MFFSRVRFSYPLEPPLAETRALNGVSSPPPSSPKGPEVSPDALEAVHPEGGEGSRESCKPLVWASRIKTAIPRIL